MDALQRDLPEDYPPVLSACSGSVCQPSQQPTSPVRVSVPRPGSNGNGRISLPLESGEELDIFSGSLDSEDLEQAQSRQSYSSRPTPPPPPLEGTTIIPMLEMLVEYPRRLPQQPGLISLPFDPERSPPPAQTTPDRVAIIREDL